jgi:hypothetical protein
MDFSSSQTGRKKGVSGRGIVFWEYRILAFPPSNSSPLRYAIVATEDPLLAGPPPGALRSYKFAA